MHKLKIIYGIGFQRVREYSYFLAAFIRCFASTEVVTLPTPPGTGVITDASSLTSSKLTSPQRFPSSSTFIPTSITTAFLPYQQFLCDTL